MVCVPDDRAPDLHRAVGPSGRGIGDRVVLAHCTTPGLAGSAGGAELTRGTHTQLRWPGASAGTIADTGSRCAIVGFGPGPTRLAVPRRCRAVVLSRRLGRPPFSVGAIQAGHAVCRLCRGVVRLRFLCWRRVGLGRRTARRPGVVGQSLQLYGRHRRYRGAAMRVDRRCPCGAGSSGQCGT